MRELDKQIPMEEHSRQREELTEQPGCWKMPRALEGLKHSCARCRQSAKWWCQKVRGSHQGALRGPVSLLWCSKVCLFSDTEHGRVTSDFGRGCFWTCDALPPDHAVAPPVLHADLSFNATSSERTFLITAAHPHIAEIITVSNKLWKRSLLVTVNGGWGLRRWAAPLRKTGLGWKKLRRTDRLTLSTEATASSLFSGSQYFLARFLKQKFCFLLW